MFCSIIVPLYNKGDYICDAIASVLRQSYQHFEIIVIDDGSTDNGLARLQSLSDPRIIIVEQENQGVACARNNGIERSQGELIFFLDADDWYLPAFLESMVNMAKAHPEIGFFASHYKSVKNPDARNMSWDPGPTDAFRLVTNLYALQCTADLFYTCSVVIRRNILAAFKPYFPPGEQWAEDLDLWYRLSEHLPLGYCQAQLVGYRVEVSGGLCAVRNHTVLLPVYQRVEQRAINNLMPPELQADALHVVAEEKITIARNILIAGHRFEALMQLLNNSRSLSSKRWWLSIIMCLALPSAVVSAWQNWRIRRLQNW